MRRKVLMLLTLVVLLELAYVAASAVVLHRIVPRIVDKHGTARIEWRRAWSIVPGIVHLRDVTFVIQDEHVRWSLRIGTARVTVSLPRLLSRELRIGRFDATGLEFHLRDREAGEAGPDLRPPVPAPSGVDRAPHHGHDPWTYRVLNVAVADVREIWVEGYRFRGSARLSGTSFERTPQHVALAPAHLDDVHGDVTHGERRVAENVRGRLEAALRSFDPERVTGDAVLAQLDGGAHFEADAAGLEFVNFYLTRAPWLHADGGAGRLAADLKLTAGAFAPGSRVEAESPEARMRVFDWTARGPVRFAWHVDDQPLGMFRLTFPKYELARDGAAHADALGENLVIDGNSARLGIAAPFGDLSASLSMPAAKIPDIRIVNDLLGPAAQFLFTSGSASFEARLDVPRHGDAHGSAHLAGRDIGGALGIVRLAGDMDLRLRLASGRIDTRVFDYGGSELSVRNVRVVRTTTPTGQVHGWWADAVVKHGRLQLRAPLTARAGITLKMRDSAPLMAIFRATRGLPGWVQKLILVDNVRATAELSLRRDGLDIAPLTVDGDPLELRAKLRFRKQDSRGILYARFGPLGVGLALRGNHLSVEKLTGARDWYDGQSGFGVQADPELMTGAAGAHAHRPEGTTDR